MFPFAPCSCNPYLRSLAEILALTLRNPPEDGEHQIPDRPICRLRPRLLRRERPDDDTAFFLEPAYHIKRL